MVNSVTKLTYSSWIGVSFDNGFLDLALPIVTLGAPLDESVFKALARKADLWTSVCSAISLGPLFDPLFDPLGKFKMLLVDIINGLLGCFTEVLVMESCRHRYYKALVSGGCTN